MTLLIFIGFASAGFAKNTRLGEGGVWVFTPGCRRLICKNAPGCKIEWIGARTRPSQPFALCSPFCALVRSACDLRQNYSFGCETKTRQKTRGRLCRGRFGDFSGFLVVFFGGFKSARGRVVKNRRKPRLASVRFSKFFDGFLTGRPLLRRGFGVENHRKPGFD